MIVSIWGSGLFCMKKASSFEIRMNSNLSFERNNMSNTRKIGIATDTNSGITLKEAEEHGLGIIPMPFFIDEEEFFEGLTITREVFFEKLKGGADIKTSQPSPASLCELWDKMLETYEELIYIPMSSGLSSSMSTARMMAEDYDGKVHVIDNHRISVTQKQSVYEALYMAEQGKSSAEIVELLDRTAMDASIYVAVDTLEYLKKGGRVTPAGAALASILNLKPVLQIQGDKLDAYAKVRGEKAAQEKMLQAVEKDINTRFAGKKVYIKGAYTCSEEAAEVWKQKIMDRFPGYDIELDPLALSIGCHIGEGATAITCTVENIEAPEIERMI